MAHTPDSNDSERFEVSDWFVLVLLCPLLIAFAVVMGSGDDADAPDATTSTTAADTSVERADGRLVVVILDSLRPESIADDSLMPSLHAFTQREDATVVNLYTCKANFTLPCVQTMFEGRESPFVAGLHNFTGQAGSQASLPGMLDRAGYGVAMISDHTLDSLYAAHALDSLDVQVWNDRDHLERDLGAIDEAYDHLADERVDALLLHTVGTDKSAHKDHPGSERYRHHFGEVDEAIGKFLSELDLARDSVVIVGDHGHGEHGHHTRDSVAIFAGRAYQTLFDQLPEQEEIEQIDLLYFMSYPLGLPVPTSYEGAAYLPETPAGRVADFLDIQREHLAAAGAPAGASVAEAMAHMRAKQAAERFDPLFKYAPLMLLFALFIAQALAALRAPPSAADIQVLLALLFASVPVALLTSAERGLWLCLPILVGGAWAAWRQNAVREHLSVLLIVGVAAFTGANAGGWAEYFHTTGGFKPSLVVFYAAIYGVGALLAWLFFKSLRHLPFAAMAYAFFCLPSGLYYYQSGQNVLFALFLGALPVGLWWLIQRARNEGFSVGNISPKLWLAGAATALGAVFLSLQEAGGWEWHLHAVTWMERTPDAVAWIALAVMAGYWLWRCRSHTARAVVGVFVGFSAFFCVGLAELGAPTFVGALIPAFFLLAFLDVSERLTDQGRGDGLEALTLRRGLLVAGLSVISLWIACSGFLIQNVDFSFALAWFSEYFARESDVFAATYAATMLKVGLPPVAVLLALRTALGRVEFRPVFAGAVAFFIFKAMTLLTQIFAGTVTQTEKYHELAISELIFIYPLALMLGLLYFVIRGVDRVVRR